MLAKKFNIFPKKSQYFDNNNIFNIICLKNIINFGEKYH